MFTDAIKHREVMSYYLNSLSGAPCVFKGGSALMFCYGLDRMSEDLDFDVTSADAVEQILICATKNRGYQIRIAKATKTGRRYVVHYTEVDTLDIDLSARNSIIDTSKYQQFYGLNVYTLGSIFRQKLTTIEMRTKARDIYDLAFILKNHKDKLSYEDLYCESIDKFYYMDWEELAFRFDNAKVNDKLLMKFSGDEIALTIFTELLG